MPYVPVLAFLTYKGRIGGGEKVYKLPCEKEEGRKQHNNEIKINI